MGGGTRAGMTPALDTPTECPEKKLTELEGERNKQGTKLVSVLRINKSALSLSESPEPFTFQLHYAHKCNPLGLFWFLSASHQQQA